MTTRNLPIIAFTCLTTLSAICAQNEPQRPATRPNQDPSRTAQDPSRMSGATTTEADRILATCIMIANNNEIALAEHAQARLQNPEAKQFAQMMIKDHGDFGRKLQKFSSVTPGDGHGGQRDASGDSSHTGHTGQTGEKPAGEKPAGERPVGERPAGENPTGRDAADASGMRHTTGGLDHAALAQELGRKHLESAKKMLDEKQGAEFDQCYIGMQIGAHACVLDELEVFANHASPELRAVFTEAQQTVRTHLDRAKQIGKDLMGKPAGTGR